MGKVLCFGELLLRLSPGENWLQDNDLPAFVGGAEANVATALALWGQDVGYCTALPDNYISKQLAIYLEQKNIDTSSIHYSGNRIGLYFLQQGTDVKHSGIVYDRANSSFAELKKGMINWDSVFEGVDWFHLSAIAASVSQSAADVCEEALIAAQKKGIVVSLDLNYRNKLWQYGKQPADVMPNIAKYCDLIMGNVWAAHKMLDIPLNEEWVKHDSKDHFLQQAAETSKQIKKSFPKVRAVANTFRFDKGNGITYYTTLFNDQLYVSAEYESDKVIDKVGSGDCYMAGLIYGRLNEMDPQAIVDFATAAAFSKLFIKGDTTTQSVQEIKATIRHGQATAN